ncbi:MAG TPA: hypothetical protein VFU21_24410 [Kofleriaceae bacterium]|nr:hypothetical protein [Kofleriaceae bacterium]
MKRLSSTLLSLFLAAACGAADAGAPEPAARSPHSVVSTASSFQFAGLIPIDALSLLPKGAQRPTPGYPGHGFSMGVIRDSAGWQSFAAAAKLRDLPAIDFSRQMVVFAVLDAQTNALSQPSWQLQAAGRAVFRFEWSGIEPFYVDRTPATLAVVDRAGVKSIAFSTTDGQDLATVTL